MQDYCNRQTLITALQPLLGTLPQLQLLPTPFPDR